MNHQRLRSSSIEELIEYAEKNRVVIHSRIYRPIIQADIANHLKFEGIKFYDTEVKGVSLENYIWLAGIDIAFSQPTDIENFLIEQGIGVQYLNNLYDALAVYLYENDIPTPRIFWIRLPYKIPSRFYNMSDAQFESITPYKINRINFLWLHHLFFMQFFFEEKFPTIREALCYQSAENLYSLADSLQGKYIRSKRGVLAFLLNRARYKNSVLEKFLIPLCDYPGRRNLVLGYKGSLDLFVFTSYSQLLFPPRWFEKQYLENPIQFLGKSISQLIAETYVDINQQPITRSELWELVETKNPDLIYFSNEIILKSCGWSHITEYKRYLEKENNFELVFRLKSIGFSLIDQPNLCPNRTDVYLEKQHGFAITFGTLGNFECYSPEDLLGAFIIDEENDFATFRNPLHQNQVFTIPQVEMLLKFLQNQRPQDLPFYQKRSSPLIRKIVRMLTIAKGIDVEKTKQKLRELTGSDREHTIELFLALFRAGMYQRTWKGPAFGYPLKTIETQGSCQKDIEEKMTPELAKIDEEYELLKNKTIINQTSMLYSADTIYPQRLLDFVSETAQGNFCVGGGSQLMIETAYNYLLAMGVTISNFNYQQFEGASTHR
jgi:hypothetical protein